jgi:hypothetical protein
MSRRNRKKKRDADAVYDRAELTLFARPVIGWAIYGGNMDSQPVVANFGYEGGEPDSRTAYGEDPEHGIARDRVIVPAAPGYFQLFITVTAHEVSEEPGLFYMLVAGADAVLEEIGATTPVVAALTLHEAIYGDEASRLLRDVREALQQKHPMCAITEDRAA